MSFPGVLAGVWIDKGDRGEVRRAGVRPSVLTDQEQGQQHGSQSLVGWSVESHGGLYSRGSPHPHPTAILIAGGRGRCIAPCRPQPHFLPETRQWGCHGEVCTPHGPHFSFIHAVECQCHSARLWSFLFLFSLIFNLSTSETEANGAL